MNVRLDGCREVEIYDITHILEIHASGNTILFVFCPKMIIFKNKNQDQYITTECLTSHEGSQPAHFAALSVLFFFFPLAAGAGAAAVGSAKLCSSVAMM